MKSLGPHNWIKNIPKEQYQIETSAEYLSRYE